jgi:hypothetical protein
MEMSRRQECKSWREVTGRKQEVGTKEEGAYIVNISDTTREEVGNVDRGWPNTQRVHSLAPEPLVHQEYSRNYNYNT